MNCWLRNNWNWVASSTNPNPFWRGAYTCKGCGHHFTATIERFDQQLLQLTLEWFGTISHPTKSLKRTRVVGEERTELAKRICSEGVQNVYSQRVTIEKRIEKHILHKIKSQFVHRNRLDADIIIDTDACKRLFDASYPPETPGRIKGYMQDISLCPFGFLLISNIQVRQMYILRKDLVNNLQEEIKLQIITIFEVFELVLVSFL